MKQEITTPWGVLRGVSAAAFWPDGTTPRSLSVVEENVLESPLGPLVPLWLPDEKRHPRVEPVAFHKNGMFRALPLQKQAVVPTPAGPVPAELLVFHPSGALARVFPLAGKLSGFWNWRDEYALSTPLMVPLPAAQGGAREMHVVGLNFHESGKLAGLTIWPDDTLELTTPLGPATARNGAAFYEDGALASFEPAAPLEVDTPIGRLTAFDPDPEGISGDLGSVAFAPDGRLTHICTVSERIAIKLPDGGERVFSPDVKAGLCDDTDELPAPLAVVFEAGRVLIGPDAEPFPLDAGGFEIRPMPRALRPLMPIAFPCSEG